MSETTTVHARDLDGLTACGLDPADDSTGVVLDHSDWRELQMDGALPAGRCGVCAEAFV